MKEKCPTCDSLFNESGEHSPFCSERCKLIDLGQWLEGNYRIPGKSAGFNDDINGIEQPETKH